MAFAFQTPLIGKMGEIAVCRQWIFLFFWNVLNFINIHIPDKERSACRSEAGGVWAIRALHSKNLINTSANSRWETFIVVFYLLDFNFPDKAIETCVWSSQVPQPTQSQAGTLSSLVSCRLLPINRFGTASANSQSECLQRSSKCSKLSV